MSEWIPIEEKLPDTNCLAFYKNALGKERIVKAFYAKQFEIDQSEDEDCQEYDENTDRYYLPEGWYECIDNWADYSCVAIIEGDITHWMPLPEFPKIEI